MEQQERDVLSAMMDAAKLGGFIGEEKAAFCFLARMNEEEGLVSAQAYEGNPVSITAALILGLADVIVSSCKSKKNTRKALVVAQQELSRKVWEMWRENHPEEEAAPQ